MVYKFNVDWFVGLILKLLDFYFIFSKYLCVFCRLDIVKEIVWLFNFKLCSEGLNKVVFYWNLSKIWFVGVKIELLYISIIILYDVLFNWFR